MANALIYKIGCADFAQVGLEQALQRVDVLQCQIQACEAQIATTLKRLSDEDANVEVAGHTGRTPRDRALCNAPLHATLGVDLTVIPTIGVETALVVASEIGPDLSRFPSLEHFCSWLTLAPGTRISGDKPRGGRPLRRVNRAGQALRVAASTARHSQSFIGAAHRARLTRLDHARAIKATAHQLARLIHATLTRGEASVERGINEFEEPRRTRQLRNLHRQAHRLGATVSFNEEKTVA